MCQREFVDLCWLFVYMCRDYSSLVVDPTLLETHASHVFIKKHFFFISFSVSVAICKSPPPPKKTHPITPFWKTWSRSCCYCSTYWEIWSNSLSFPKSHLLQIALSEPLPSPWLSLASHRWIHLEFNERTCVMERIISSFQLQFIFIASRAEKRRHFLCRFYFCDKSDDIG